MMRSPGLLIILDGWGHAAEVEHNAIRLAATPAMTGLMAQHPWTVLRASGEAVGLPARAVGNSEIGHLTIGAGRVIEYESTRVERAIASGELCRHTLLQGMFARLRTGTGRLHLLGLNSDGMVHGHIKHLGALLETARAGGLTRVFLHPSTDGRDVPDGTAGEYLHELTEMRRRIGLGTIATVIGRAYTMDRNENWPRTEAAYRALVLGDGIRVQDPKEAIDQASAQGKGDEWIPPTVMCREDGTPVGRLQDGDALICANFRGDRMRQLLRSLTADAFSDFLRQARPQIDVVTMGDYFLFPPVPPLFPQADAANGLADLLDVHGVRNVRIAETEKFPHVTFFMNGRDGRPREFEERVHVPSPKGVDYRRVPELSIEAVTGRLIEAVRRPDVGLVVANLANADVLGHTGDLNAVIRAVGAVDGALGRVCTEARKTGRWVIVVGDHGNAETMWDRTWNKPHVGHTINPVPFLLIDAGQPVRLRPDGTLADIAPTVADLLQIAVTPTMTGATLRRTGVSISGA